MNWINFNYKKLFTNSLLVALGIVVPLLFLEFILSFTSLKGIVSENVYPRYYFVKDREIGLDIAPDFSTTSLSFYEHPYDVWSNSLGCFDYVYSSTTPYIYLTGDSFTWGFAPFADKWGTILESRVGTRVLKCGVGGFGTKQELIKTSRDMARLAAPKLIIVGYFGFNDPLDDANFPRNTVYDGYRVGNFAFGSTTEAQAESNYKNLEEYCVANVPTHPVLQRVKCVLFTHSIIYNLLRNNLKTFFTGILAPGTLESTGFVVDSAESVPDPLAAQHAKEDYARHLQNVDAFKTLAAKENAKLLFVLIPDKDIARSTSTDPVAFANYRLTPFLDAEKIMYLDLAPAFRTYEHLPAQPLYWPTDGHWNQKGNHLAGLVLSRYLLENGLVDVVNRTAKIADLNAEILREFGAPAGENQ